MKRFGRLAAVCGMFVLFAFGLFGVFGCAGSGYGRVRIDLSSTAVNNSEVNIAFDPGGTNTFSVTASVSGMPRRAQSSQAFVREYKPEVVSPIGEPTVSGNDTTFVFEVHGGGQSRIVFWTEGGREEAIYVNVTVDVFSIRIDETYRPLLMRGTTYEIDTTRVLFNNVGLDPDAVDATINRDFYFYLPDYGPGINDGIARKPA